MPPLDSGGQLFSLIIIFTFNVDFFLNTIKPPGESPDFFFFLFLLPGYTISMAFNKYTIECSKTVCFVFLENTAALFE